MLRQLKPINDEMKALRVTNEGFLSKIQSISNECDALSANIECKVDVIEGDTIIRTLKTHAEKSLQTMPARDLHIRLRESGNDATILFSGDEGSFEWKLSKPET